MHSMSIVYGVLLRHSYAATSCVQDIKGYPSLNPSEAANYLFDMCWRLCTLGSLVNRK